MATTHRHTTKPISYIPSKGTEVGGEKKKTKKTKKTRNYRMTELILLSVHCKSDGRQLQGDQLWLLGS